VAGDDAVGQVDVLVDVALDVQAEPLLGLLCVRECVYVFVVWCVRVRACVRGQPSACRQSRSLASCEFEREGMCVCVCACVRACVRACVYVCVCVPSSVSVCVQPSTCSRSLAS
jgi:hypothetical protein